MACSTGARTLAVAADDGDAGTAVVGDAAVGALCAGSDCLPDDFAVVAETELVGAVADY